MSNAPDAARPIPLLSTSTIVGDDVVDRDGETIGTIDDLLVDTTDGDVPYAVVACGGMLGLGEAKHVVPMAAPLLDAEERRFVLRVSREDLAAAPTLPSGGLPETSAADVREAYHRHWSRVPLLTTDPITALHKTDWRGPRPVLFPGFPGPRT